MLHWKALKILQSSILWLNKIKTIPSKNVGKSKINTISIIGTHKNLIKEVNNSIKGSSEVVYNYKIKPRK
jgi:hypothetical protein